MLELIKDDKSMVILCVTAITIISIFFPMANKEIVSMAFTGLFGVAIGKSLNNAK